jgi:beta-mannosidase
MISQSLSTSASVQWTFRQAGTQEEWLPAMVPGGVHTDLLALEMIPDPFYADNELKVMWVAETDWEYKGRFAVTSELAEAKHLFLTADGLDTLADVFLNGELIASVDNMFRQYRWDVAGKVKSGANEVNILFRSTVNFCRRRNEEKPLTVSGGMSLPGGVFARKAPCHFGWDWGPRLAPVGVWRDLRLEAYGAARLADVHVRQAHGTKGVTISASVKAEIWQGEGLRACMSVTSPDGKKRQIAEEVLYNGKTDLSVVIKKPLLWWPNGYGEQPLYTVEIEILSPAGVEDRKSYRLGLRTVEVRREPDQWGESFTFIVNGVPVFMKGSDWIPADSFPTRMNGEAYERLIRSAAETHQNMLRVWGGGFYEDECFYDLCDRYGILLWHDFMFACYVYPHDEEAFVANLRLEVEDNVRRLRHRTCLALWCGNNEMEQGWVDWGWGIREDPLYVTEKAAYEQFFYHTLPAWVAELDPDTMYWPSSASSNTPMKDPNSQDRGDMHYWDVWHGRKPFTAYRTAFPRFMSEFGFQSLPPIETVATYAEKKDWNMTSFIMEHHQRSGSGNGLMIGQMTDTFRMPKDFPMLTYLSMLLQAEGIRYGVEHWRRNKNRVSGTLYWQLNDCWPVASWASLDYYGRWKALHYAAKRFYAPVMLSIEDTGTKMDLHVTSDVTVEWKGCVRWVLMTIDGHTLKSGECGVEVAALQNVKAVELDFSADINDSNRRSVVLIAELYAGEERVSSALAGFCPIKHLDLQDPGLDVAVFKEGKLVRVVITSRTLARFVELKLADADVVFSDNYIDVPAGWSVSVTCALPTGWSLARVRKALQVTSLYDSFA